MYNEAHNSFLKRHIGPQKEEIQEMLEELAITSVDELIDQTIPKDIRLSNDDQFQDGGISEFRYLNDTQNIGDKNELWKSYIGLGYHNCITPSVILRNVFENPAWYTAYTPYQPEISQGRLTALFNFQTMITSICSMEFANASLLDEATSAAEAMIMSYRIINRSPKSNKNKFFVDRDSFPQVISVLQTRAEPLEIELIIDDPQNLDMDQQYFGAFFHNPTASGDYRDLSNEIKKVHDHDALAIVLVDLFSNILMKPAGEMGADIVVGCAQRFGVPLGYGGPHPGFLATKEKFVRQIPGRLIGETIDRDNNPALRMTLQTREQHIKRAKATSNICTAQALLANISSFYAVFHGPDGLKAIAESIHKKAVFLNNFLKDNGYNQINHCFFDTLSIQVSDKAPKNMEQIRQQAKQKQINLYYQEDTIQISINETTLFDDVLELCSLFDDTTQLKGFTDESNYLSNLKRSTPFLEQEVFNSFHTETEMMRYIRSLEKKDLSLLHSMIPLGSCTMKLNAATELIPVSYKKFSAIHPFVPLKQAQGYQIIIKELIDDLKILTGFDAITLQPNSGAQGEYTGLKIIRKYLQSLKEEHRNIILIPTSAHGTNPASAAMCGFEIVLIQCTDNGDIDFDHLKEQIKKHKEHLAGLMITYPSTHGVYEEGVKDICDLIHENGGLVYLDGANLNAQLGLTSPATIGADMCHLNLHKTFAIPHGGGGPGVGPLAVVQKLAQFLPSHPIINTGGENAIGTIASAPWGSASILLITHAYLKLMGTKGCKEASKIAILNANYIKKRLEPYYKVLYTGKNERVAHELIIDIREIKKESGIEAVDIAKRLIDYNFHSPTVAFPVVNTLMIEPTESESKKELDRFCDAMISIYKEIQSIEQEQCLDNNLLKNAPHTINDLVNEWNFPYTKEQAVYPVPTLKQQKFWASVSRINEIYGDKNLVCSCPSPSEWSK